MELTVEQAVYLITYTIFCIGYGTSALAGAIADSEWVPNGIDIVAIPIAWTVVVIIAPFAMAHSLFKYLLKVYHAIRK